MLLQHPLPNAIVRAAFKLEFRLLVVYGLFGICTYYARRLFWISGHELLVVENRVEFREIFYWKLHLKYICVEYCSK